MEKVVTRMIENVPFDRSTFPALADQFTSAIRLAPRGEIVELVKAKNSSKLTPRVRREAIRIADL